MHIRIHLLLAGAALLMLGCATPSPAPLPSASATTESKAPLPEQSGDSNEPTDSVAAATIQPKEAESEESQTPKPTTAPSTDASDEPPSSPVPDLAVLVIQAGALVTQINGDTKLRCLRPECRIPLPAGKHRVAVGYRDIAKRAGSTVTYSSMNPRVVEITLEPGHHYSVTASGRYTRKWWIAIEDQTTNKTVYNDREKP